MNIEKALLWGEEELQYLENPRLEAEVLLSVVLKKDRVFLKIDPQFPLSWFEKRLYKKYVQKRVNGFPVAQIIHSKNWAGFHLIVNRHVLIPRDETEILCEIIYRTPRKFPLKRILDVGTGSGNIAIFLKQRFPKAQVQALDISSKALRVARKNAKKYQPAIEFLKSDLLSRIARNTDYDLIVANLPYVPRNEPVSLEVRNEPRKAIFSGEDGLDALRAFAKQLQSKNIQFQELWLEFFPAQSKAIAKLFAAYHTEFFRDVGGDIRFAKISKEEKKY